MKFQSPFFVFCSPPSFFLTSPLLEAPSLSFLPKLLGLKRKETEIRMSKRNLKNRSVCTDCTVQAPVNPVRFECKLVLLKL